MQRTSRAARWASPITTVATHSIPFRGLQQQPGIRVSASLEVITLQRTQSPSGDCNAVCLQSSYDMRSLLVATHSIPFRGLQRLVAALASETRAAARCNALNPLQGIATSSSHRPSKLGLRKTCCNALNPLQGIATADPLSRLTKPNDRQVATHSIPFRGLQLPPFCCAKP